MKPLNNNFLAEKLPVQDNKTDGGIFLPTKPEQHYKVLICGPKADVLHPGDVIKPFPHIQGVPIDYEGKDCVMFNTDQLDDIISRT